MKLYIHKASLDKANVIGITRYSDYNSAAMMPDRTRGEKKRKRSEIRWILYANIFDFLIAKSDTFLLSWLLPSMAANSN